MLKFFKFCSLLSLMLTSPFALANGTTPIDEIVSKMTLKDRVGQLLLIGFRGDSVENSESIKRDIQDIGVGSVILFDYDVALKVRDRNIKNPAQLKKLNQDMQSLAKIPLFISVDEEGGMVSRLKSRYGFESKLSPMELGTSESRVVQKEMSKLAGELHENNFNMNFAPLVDVNVNPENPVIGKIKRSFSEDENTVSQLASQMIDIQNKAGIVSVLKHFPGHGSSDSDSHLGMVDVTETWQDRELTPYRDLIEDGKVDMIMSAHVYQRNLDPDYPATLSKKILGDLLRTDLGYEGVIISDDMNMGAIKDHYGFEQAIELALNAGIDILLFGNNLHYDKDTAAKASNLIIRLVNTGKISTKQINDSVTRILKLKRKAGLL
ncbi:glycoside hydrolase family 3 protein [Bacteriovorax sp. Seq25_V]|uniref:glycoside hydrolase family 3 protein n=1 Tax=Bacteriovorax sp. Seq25_V TaxID=1201288 RepID=UPI000389F4E6|nr:glycoside hydrolase family 3 protein [Bacteriovorax sp. Seq25_V]EQC44222.1 glycosyl hydrolase family 3, N-terminal domain protein [Bacteriovorax sp. Seq25_V]